MNGGEPSAVARDVQTLFGDGAIGRLTDRQLLERFVSRRDAAAEAAFTVLVERHASMVWGVCRRILHDPHDAADAFQATFLVLARRAAVVRVDDSLGRWLYGVSRRVAARARSTAARRLARESRGVEDVATSGDDWSVERSEQLAVLDEEVGRLPARYRDVLVLCDLGGLTHEQAARQLGCAVGTIGSRVTRARERLRTRLSRRGLAPMGMLAGFVPRPEMAAGAALLEDTVRAAMQARIVGAIAGVVPATVAALTEGILRGMMISKMKMAMTLVLAAGLGVAGLVLLAPGAPGAPPGRSQPSKAGVTTTPPGPVTQGRGSTEPGKAGQEAPETVIAVADSDGAKVWAVNTKTRTWHTYKAPASMKVRPFDPRPGMPESGRKPLATPGIGSFLVLEVEGERITELAAFCLKSGGWVRQSLHEPAKGKIPPNVLDEEFALYPMGRYAYAFSALTGTWDSVDLGEVRGPRVEKLNIPGMAIVKGAGPMYVYDARTGQFRDVESDEK